MDHNLSLELILLPNLMSFSKHLPLSNQTPQTKTQKTSYRLTFLLNYISFFLQSSFFVFAFFFTLYIQVLIVVG